MLQTTKKISTSTKFHLWDVLKLKKRIILHFRLFCSTFGHLKKKSPKFPQKKQKSHFFEISNFDLRPESADMWPEGWLSPQVFPKLFLCQTDKN